MIRTFWQGSILSSHLATKFCSVVAQFQLNCPQRIVISCFIAVLEIEPLLLQDCHQVVVCNVQLGVEVWSQAEYHRCDLSYRLCCEYLYVYMSRQILEQITAEELFDTRRFNPNIFISCTKLKGNTTYIGQLQAGDGDGVT